MRTKIRSLLFLVFVSINLSLLTAQNQRFNAGLVAGLNFAELEGDGITDFFGINAGVFTTANLSTKWQLGLEMLFSQNGEYILPRYYPLITYGKFRLNHLEIPIYINRTFQITDKKSIESLHINAGIAYQFLLNYYAENIEAEEVTSQIIYGSRNGLGLQTGLTVYFTRDFGLNLKSNLPLASGLDWTIAARLIYRIW